jgi:hypothetical protein
MGSLVIVPPVYGAATSATGSGNDPTYTRMFTPDPKEAFVLQAGETINVFIDFGSNQRLDSFYVGYHSAADDSSSAAPPMGGSGVGTPGSGPSAAGSGTQTVRVTTAAGLGGAETGVVVPATSLAPLGYGFPYHFFTRVAAPVASRYWKLTLSNGDTSDFYVGVLAMGIAFQTTYGTEWGAGRFIEDTGSVERLFSGGFGITNGVATTGYQFTFGDLTVDERERLFQIARRRRTTQTILVVEDPDFTDGLNDRCHWSLWNRFEAYERIDPANSRWSMKVQDWA